jgi:hypothetical protein
MEVLRIAESLEYLEHCTRPCLEIRSRTYHYCARYGPFSLGARGSVVGRGSMLATHRKVSGSSPDEVVGFFN